MTDRPVCSCHGEPMYRNGGDKFICPVKKRASEQARYRRRISTPEGKAKQNAWSRAQAERRRNDPDWKLYQSLYEMARIRVRY